ncbi:DUF4189 domain-containing protein [Stenotrophomonas sp. 278]|uniref:DUF4189 domain-containing protein n=1 Tax=Stenotrophomonas sp. 278 TaxID=2479851 RepID=UPI000F659674|nr:DUF4189 domain-containing protein [Stenotrophomonas sp. 278]RRU24720.1 DUF4189 domain-containing protein [Stenotrophomonas sp. 278]
MTHRIGFLLLVVLAACVFSGKAHAWQSCQNVVVGMVNGNQPVFQQQCTWLAGAIALNPTTRGLSSAWNHPDADKALAEVRRSCGSGCVAASFYSDHYYMAASDTDVIGWGETAELAEYQCLMASQGAPCDVVVAAGSGGAARYWYFHALGYNSAQDKGYAWREAHRRRDARTRVQNQCGNESECFVFVYTQDHAAIARSESGKLYASDGKTAGQARRAARKYCAKEEGGKAKCEVVTEAK